MSEPSPPLRLAILGAGPIGLDAALAATERGLDVTIYEAGKGPAEAVRGWSHVRVFTPWSMNVSPRMQRALEAAGQTLPTDEGSTNDSSTDAEAYPTGAELLEHLYEPLAALPQVANALRLGERVRQVGRQGLLKHEEIGTSVRGAQPFRLLVQDSSGVERIDTADVVLDCTGCPVAHAIGAGGIAAPGEEAAADRIHRDIPESPADVAGSTTLLLGAGHSAQTALHTLAQAAESDPATRVVWVLRRPVVFEDNDPLPGRKDLGEVASRLLADPPAWLDVRLGRAIGRLTRTDDGVEVGLIPSNSASAAGAANTETTAEPEIVNVHRVLALVGAVGDHRLYRQLQVHECYATAGPMKLAGALLAAGGAGGDCLAQSSAGPEALKTPEPGFFILGRKSYGRRNDFLMRTGFEQVDEVFSLLG